MIAIGSGSVKEDTNLEIESKITDESDSKVNEDSELGDKDQEKNEMGSEVNLSEAEPEMNPDSSIHSAETLVAKSCDNSETDGEINFTNFSIFAVIHLVD